MESLVLKMRESEGKGEMKRGLMLCKERTCQSEGEELWKHNLTCDKGLC